MSDEIRSARLDAEPQDRFVRLRAPLGVTSFGINGLVLEPGNRNRIHRHRNQEEVYVVLDGTLTLTVEGEPLQFGPGEVVRVAPHTRRQLVNRGPDRLRLLALGGMLEHEHVPRDADAYTDWESDPAPVADVPVPADLPPDQRD